MNPEDIGHAIDEITSRLGAAKPLAEAIVNEFVLSNLIIGLSMLVVIIASAFASAWGLRRARGMDDDGDREFVSSIIYAAFFIPLIVVIPVMIRAFSRAVAPHYYILKDLF